MGDCYSVELRVKVNPEKSTVSNLQKLLRQWMKEQAERTDVQPRVDWSLSTYKEAGIRPDSFAGICKILLAFHQGDCRHVKDDEGFDVFVSGFNASYGWYSVMVNAFGKMAWALEEGSRLEIDRDEGHVVLETERDPDTGNMEVWENHHPLRETYKEFKG